jgi:hypothetical protein
VARLLTVPAGWSDAYAPTIGELQTLAAALSGTDAVINQAAESFSVEYPSMDAVLGFVEAGGIYVDYCGWPMFYGYGSSIPGAKTFGQFLSSLGADRYYCDGFDTSQGGCAGYPYDRGWLSKYDVSSPFGLIYGKGGVTCSYNVSGSFGGGTVDSVYPMVAVRSAGGKGIYFYGAAGSDGAVDPSQFAQFILSFLSQGGPGSGQTLQQQCVAGGGVWYDNQCLTQAEYECIASGGLWANGVCQPPTKGGTVTPVASPINWPLVGGLSLLGLGLIGTIIALVAE